MHGMQVWSLAAGYTSFGVAAVVTLAIIPSDMRPQYGWPLAYEWFTFLMCTLLSGWHKVCLLSKAPIGPALLRSVTSY